jgi:hypothetical protein
MPDTTIKKVEAGTSPRGEMGQKYLVAGKRVSMRLWVQEPAGKLKGPTKREYETVGYVISGKRSTSRPGIRGWSQPERCTTTRSSSPSLRWRQPRLRRRSTVAMHRHETR